MNEAIVWLEEGFQQTYQCAMKRSQQYEDVWIVGWELTDYTSRFKPLQHCPIYDPFFSIKEDSR